MKFNGIEEIDASESEAIRISVENGVLSIGGLTRGLYILKVGTKTLKFSI